MDGPSQMLKMPPIPGFVIDWGVCQVKFLGMDWIIRFEGRLVSGHNRLKLCIRAGWWPGSDPEA